MRRIWWIILALALVGGGVFAYMRINANRPLEEGIVQLPGKGDGAVAAWSDGFTVIDDKQLVCVNAEGETLWTSNLPYSGMQARRDGSYTLAWSQDTVCIIDASGIILDTLQIPGEILFCRAGKEQFACITSEEGQHRLRAYSIKNNTLIDEERFPDKTVLDAEYYGDALNQIWVLSVDTHGTQPVTRVNTYQPGRKTTGDISVSDEIGYNVTVNGSRIHFVGSHHIYVWEQSGDVADEKAIYGWNLQDMLAGAQGISYLLAPATPYGQPIGTLWYMGADGTQNFISLPMSCTQAVIGGKGLMAIHAQGVYTMGVNGSNMKSYKLAFAVEEVAAVSPGKAFVVRSGHNLYLIPIV